AGVSPTGGTCAGDCDGNGMVTINELVLLVNIALGSEPVSACPAGDIDHNGVIAINEIITAVNNALGMCGGGGHSPATPPAERIRRASMDSKTLAVLVTVGFSLLGVLGDYFLKLASAQERSLSTASFFIGFAVYASTAFGWVFVMKHLKLATISVVYSVSMIVLLTTVGIIGF